MNRDHSEQPTVFRELLASLNEGTLSERQEAQIERLVVKDVAARRFYLETMFLYGHLRWKHSHDTAWSEDEEQIGSTAVDLGQEAVAVDQSAEELPLGDEAPTPDFPVFPFPSLSSLPSPFSPPFVGGPVFSYLTATVFVGMMLLGAWAYKITHHQHIVEAPSKSVPSDIRPEMVFVGRITGIFNVKWSKDKDFLPPLGFAYVPLGRIYKLDSGLIQITYDSGAKVILEGPCTYEVDSCTGGYLSLGKLTAKVDKRGGGRGARGEGDFPSPLFAVRTPTAIVTDLSTEFGVEVDEKGATEVHVLQGEVVSEPRYVGDGSDRSVHVKAGEAARIEPDSGEFTPVALAANHFVRQLLPPSGPDADAKYIHAVLSDKPLAYWPLNEPARSRRFADRSGNGFHGWAIGVVRNGQPGPLSPKSRSVEMDGTSYIDVGLQERFALANKFTVEAWISVDPSAGMARIISADNAVSDFHSTDRIGWSLEYVGTTRFGNTSPCLAFTAYGTKDAAFKTVSVTVSKWTHVVVVFDRNNAANLFVDGQLKSTLDVGAAARVGPVWLSLGTMSNRQHLWRGRLAHVAVYPHELSAERIQNHYQHSLQGPEREGGLRPKAP